MSTVGRFGFSRAAAFALVLSGSLALVLPGAAASEDLRVLLMESGAPIWVGGVQVAPAADGLRVDGRRAGPRWVAPGPGPHRAGPLRVRGRLAVERSD
ncbi:MAG: hypothetical protein OEP95_15105, partial [Myxococcales bacterium]|nr:hypothetical protein [Myxococcales bacterium]